MGARPGLVGYAPTLQAFAVYLMAVSFVTVLSSRMVQLFWFVRVVDSPFLPLTQYVPLTRYVAGFRTPQAGQERGAPTQRRFRVGLGVPRSSSWTDEGSVKRFPQGEGCGKNACAVS